MGALSGLVPSPEISGIEHRSDWSFGTGLSVLCSLHTDRDAFEWKEDEVGAASRVPSTFIPQSFKKFLLAGVVCFNFSNELFPLVFFPLSHEKFFWGEKGSFRNVLN